MAIKNKNILSRRELYAAMALALPISSMAAVVSASGGPSVGQVGNVPVVEIVKPNGAGVSHNQFGQFDVGAQGVVLNNSGTAATSQLAGQIAGNGNLAGGAASVIIAEVTGNAKSQLNGALEIAGRQAALIVANPNGITANGASFINASRVTLTTGTPQLDAAGKVASIDVARGVISISGKGIDASGVEMADLMARSIELNAQLKARNLRLVTGHNKAAYGDAADSISGIDGEGTAPTVALDVGSMGGMYANAIRMVGTETGVGVNIAGKIKADNTLDMKSGGAMHVKAGGELKSDRDIQLAVATSLTNDGIIAAKRDVSTKGKEFRSTSDAWFAAGRNTAINFSTIISEGNNGSRPAGVPGRNSWSEPTTEKPKPVEPAKPVSETKPVEPAKPVAETKPAEPAKPVAETKPAEPAKPVAETKPVEPAKPVAETKPVEPAKPAEETKPSRQESVDSFVQQLLNSIFNQLSYGYSSSSYGYSPSSASSYGNTALNRPSYGYGYGYPSYGFPQWRPVNYQPRPVYSPWSPVASYGYSRPMWRSY